MNNNTSNINICKNVEYITMFPWMEGTYTVIIDDKEKHQREEIRKLNMIISGEYDPPCQCPRCRTSA